jgi:hypothetical protein
MYIKFLSKPEFNTAKTWSNGLFPILEINVQLKFCSATSECSQSIASQDVPKNIKVYF